MKIKYFSIVMKSYLLLATAVMIASAQGGRIEGNVKEKGTGKPVAKALIEIVRMDIVGNYSVKTDKKGHFLQTGMPTVGTYTLLVSADGFAPSYVTNLPSSDKVIDIELSPGNGSKLTINEVRRLIGKAEQKTESPSAHEVRGLIEKAEQETESPSATWQTSYRKFADELKLTSDSEAGVKFDKKEITWAGIFESIEMGPSTGILEGKPAKLHINLGKSSAVIVDHLYPNPSTLDRWKQVARGSKIQFRGKIIGLGGFKMEFRGEMLQTYILTLDDVELSEEKK